MKDQLLMLLDLQKLDLESDEINQVKQGIESDLEEAKQILGRLEDDLVRQRAVLQETVELQKDKERERAELEERYKKSKGRLSKVTNSKEYSAIELEIEAAKRQSGQIEEDLVKLMEAIELTSSTVSEKELKIQDLSSQIEGESTRSATRLAELSERRQSLSAKREEIAKNIKKEIIRRYSFIRSRRDGIAIVAARDGCCQGCFMQLPPQHYNEIQRGNSFHFCPSCQRILYFEAHEQAVESTGT